jgi:hypothetical protein
MKDKQFDNWGNWDGTECDETKEEKNFRKQQDIWRDLNDKKKTNFYANFYGGNDKNDGAHPESKQFKDFEEALWSSNGKKIAKVASVWLFFFLIFSALSGAIMAAKEEEMNELKNKSDFERLFAQENLRSKSEIKNMDRYFGSPSNDKNPK